MNYGSLRFAHFFPAGVGEDHESDGDGGLLSLDIAYQASRNRDACEPGSEGFDLVVPESAFRSAADAHEKGSELLKWNRPVSIAIPLGLLSASSQWRDTARSLIISAALHLALFSAIYLFFSAEPIGVGGIGQGAIMVRLLDQESVTAEAPSPASVDSPGSVASLAKRVRKPDRVEGKTRREKTKRAFDANELAPEDSPRPLHTEIQQETLMPDRREDAERKQARKDTITVKSASLADSAASAPSIASAQRRLMTAEGKESHDFKDKILGAIHQAAYYPKAALMGKYHGEVAVAFTLARDGSIMSLNIERGSGLPILDEAALQIIRKAAEKFPSLPDALTRDKVSYVVPIVFKERRSKGQ